MLRQSTHEIGPRPEPGQAVAHRAAGRFIFVVASLLATSAMIVPTPVSAHNSDPVRNLFPEEPACRDTVQNPAYAAMPVGSAADTDHPPAESLLQEFLSKHTSMDYPAAAEAALRLINATPDRPAGYYNLACTMARMQRADEAFAALEQAIDRGWRDRLHMSIDPDLAWLRRDERFALMLRRLQERAEAERIQSEPWRSDPWQAVVADLMRETPALLTRHHVPGAVIAFIDDGQLVWTSAFGVRDTRTNDALCAEDRFRLRAPLHLFAIAACQKLEEQSKIELATLIVEAANEHVATMTVAGGALGDDDSEKDRRAQPAGAGDRPVLGAANSVSDGRQASVRSSMRSYSRQSVYGFLRLAIETASGRAFPRICETTLLGPLGLTRTGFSAPSGDEALVPGHSYLGTPLRPGVIHGEFAPGGCVYMTGGDLARLIASTLPPSTEDDPQTAVFKEDRTAHHPRDQRAQAALAGAVDLVTQADDAMSGALGLALQRQDTEHGLRMQLDESAAGVVCLVRWHPQTRRGVVILCNSATAGDAAEHLAHLALGGE